MGNRNRSKGRRYTQEPKLNIKKVIAVIIAIAVIIMFVILLKKFLTEGTSSRLQTTQYFSLYSNNKWGVIDSSGNIVIEPTYDEMIIIPNSKNAIFICTTDVNYEAGTYKTKVMNEKGKEIFEDFDKVEAIENYDENNTLWYEEEVLKVQKNGKYGLINYNGETILECEYDAIDSLKGVKNSLLIEKDSKTGLANNKGNIIVDVQYKEIKMLGETATSYIVINEEGKYGVSNILDTKYEDIKSIDNTEMFLVKENGEYKVIDSEENEILTEGFDDIENIIGANIIIKESDKFGIVNVETDKSTKVDYDEIRYANNNKFIARKDGKYGLINLDEETLLDFKYSDIVYSNQANIFEVTYEENEITINEILDENLEAKSNGIISEINSEKNYIKVWTEEGYKYYNFKFEEQNVSDLLKDNTIFVSKKDGKYGFVDKNGKIIVDYIYDDATEQNIFGFACIKKDGKWGCIDKNGKIIQEPKYELENNLLIDFIGRYHISADLNAYYYTDE